jgi:hypothetical protein
MVKQREKIYQLTLMTGSSDFFPRLLEIFFTKKAPRIA